MNQEPQPHRILLVEDDAPLASMVADFLTPHGFEVAIESRGDAAVDRVLQEQPDVVVLDVNLPGLDGLAVCRAVRAEYRGAIVMLTARGEEIDEVLGLEVGADDYLAKPVRPRALLARLRTHLRKADRSQKSDLSKQHPEVLAKLKRQLLEINAIVARINVGIDPVGIATNELDERFDSSPALAESQSFPRGSKSLYNSKSNPMDRLSV